MDVEDVAARLQEEADNELSGIETFSESIREKIKSEYDRMIKERNEWLEIHSDDTDCEI